jgi:hypothetical protein
MTAATQVEQEEDGPRSARCAKPTTAQSHKPAIAGALNLAAQVGSRGWKLHQGAKRSQITGQLLPTLLASSQSRCAALCRRVSATEEVGATQTPDCREEAKQKQNERGGYRTEGWT